jgi:hypothetical protein
MPSAAGLNWYGCVAIDREAQRPAHPHVVERADLGGCTSSSAPGECTPDRSLIVSGNPSGRAAVDQT